MGKQLGGNSSLINKGSVFDLAATYIMLFKDNSITNQQKQDVIKDFCRVLSSGWTFKELVQEMHNCIRQRNKVRVDDIVNHFTKHIRKNRHQNNANILNPTQLYYHKELKIMNKPNVVDVDYETGTMVSEQQDFFLEMAASYTLNNLADYFLSKDMVDVIEYPRNRVVGLLKYYVEKYGLDETLFMIEAANQFRLSEEKRIINIREFENYYSQAKSFKENIRNSAKSTDCDKIVPRRRKLFY